MAKGTCAYDGCEDAAHSRGWCSYHYYKRWHKTGSPDAPTRMTDEQRAASRRRGQQLARERRRAKVKRYYVYALVDPRDNEIRYVGMSSSVAERRNGHIQSARNPKNGDSVRLQWLRDLLAEDAKPIAITLAEHDDEPAALDAEVWWIACLRADGVRLTNQTAGGLGIQDPTPELRAKLRDRPPRQMDMTKAREALAAKRATPGYVIPVPDQTGYRHTEETKAKLRAAWARRKGVVPQ